MSPATSCDRIDGVSPRKLGFTLLELIVVIAIVATLASLVAPAIFRNTGDARVVAARTQMEILGLALDSYRLDNGTYPSNSEGLEALVKAPLGLRSWRGPYLRKSLPLDPWGYPYVFELIDSGGDTDFRIRSLGRDGAPGGVGEDADLASTDSSTSRR